VDGNNVVAHAVISGINPYFQTRREISHIIRLELPRDFFKRRWEKIYFYGAGCSNPDRNKIVELSLVAQFKTPVEVASDLVGAAHGLLQNEAGLACILTAGRAKGIDPVYGEGYEMDAIASCFIGGASAYGGTGKVSGMIIGAILMGVINKGMIIVGVDANYQKVVKGIVLLIAVMFDVLSKRQKR
jgi:hypothetical protein